MRDKLVGKINSFEYQAGLVVTSEREYTEGNKFIRQELGSIIFNFEVENEIKEGILHKYEYYLLRYQSSEKDHQLHYTLTLALSLLSICANNQVRVFTLIR